MDAIDRTRTGMMLPERSGRAVASGAEPNATRDGRLSRSLSGTNLARAGDYNQRTVLQAIRLSPGTTRVEIAQRTGLTAATIANITKRLSDLGLVEVVGRKVGGLGQPALQLKVASDGAFGIGLNIDRDHLTLVTLDLAGEVRSRTTWDVAFATPGDVKAFVRKELGRTLKAGRVDRDRVLGIGVAIPDDLGRINLPDQPSGYKNWDDTDVRAMLDMLPWDIHLDNDASAAALGETQYGAAYQSPSFFYLLISAGLGGGVIIDRIYHRGATARSGEIGLMPDTTSSLPGATVQDTVSVSALLARLRAAGHKIAGATALATPLPGAEAVIDQWIFDAVRVLKGPMIAINCILDPDAVLIGGRLPLSLIEKLAERMTQALAQEVLPSRATIRPAVMAQDAPAIGAAILPFLDRILPSDSNLIQAGRG